MKATRVEILRQAVTKIVPILAGKKIAVTQMGTRAYVVYHPKTKAPVTINIPNLPDNASEELVIATQGFIDHECAHVLFTDSSVLEAAVRSDVHSLTNILEDTFVERRMRELYKGASSNLGSVWQFLTDKLIKPALAQAQAQGNPSALLTTALPTLMRQHAGQKMLEDVLKPYMGDLQKYVDIIGPDLLGRIPKITSTQESYELAVAMHNRLEEARREQERQEQEKREQERKKKEAEQQAERERQKTANKNLTEEEYFDDESEEEEGDEEESGDKGSGKGNDSKGGGSDDKESDDDSGSGESEDDQQDEGKGDEEQEDEQPSSSGDADGSDDENQDEDGDEEEDSAGAGSGDEQEDESDDEEESSGGDSSDEDDADDESEDEEESEQQGDDESDEESDEEEDEDESDEEDDQGDARGLGEDDDEESDEEEDEDEQSGAPPRPERLEAEDEDEDEEEDEDADGKEKEKPTSETDVHVEADTVEPLKNAFKSAQDMDTMVNVLISDQIRNAVNTAPYYPFTKDFDKIYEFHPKRKPEELAQVYENMEQQIAAHVAPLQRNLERLIQARSQSRFIGGYRSGRLHGAALHRAATGDDRLFRRKFVATTKDTAVSLVVDCSGSMAWGKLPLAMQSALAMSMSLDRLNITHEVSGFTTMECPRKTKDGREVRELIWEAAQTTGRTPSRIEPINMPIFKPFSRRLDAERKMAMAGYDEVECRCNTDGESVEYAAKRLLGQRQARKVMIVLSDGQPNGGSGSFEECSAHLKQVVKDITAAGVDVFGIGIMDDAVRHYYPKFAVLSQIEQLPTTIMKELERMIVG